VSSGLQRAVIQSIARCTSSGMPISASIVRLAAAIFVSLSCRAIAPCARTTA